jgi:hypothetical protein
MCGGRGALGAATLTLAVISQGASGHEPKWLCDDIRKSWIDCGLSGLGNIGERARLRAHASPWSRKISATSSNGLPTGVADYAGGGSSLAKVKILQRACDLSHQVDGDLRIFGGCFEQLNRPTQLQCARRNYLELAPSSIPCVRSQPMIEPVIQSL